MSVTLDLQVPIVVRTHAAGSVYAWPLADPELVCRGDSAEDVGAIAAMFLAEHLARLPGEAVAAFTLPPDARLMELPVVLARDDLPPRFGIDGPIGMACVAVPDGESTWVNVLALREVIHVAAGEDLLARVTDEIVRRAGDRELDDATWLSLLPAQGHALVRIDVRVVRSDLADAGARAREQRERNDDRARRQARELLDSIGVELVARLTRHPPPPAVARSREVQFLAALLSGHERTQVALVGPAQAGKTAVLEALLSQAVVPFRQRPVFATSGSALVAGQSGFGQLPQRITEVMRAAELLDAILYFDNLADLFAGTAGGIEDLAAALRPWLLEGRVRVLGECTAAAFEQFEKRHGTIMACFHRVAVEPLSAEHTREVLRARALHAQRTEPRRPTLQPEAVAPLVELCERYLPDQAFPGKAVRLFDELRAIHQHDVDQEGRPHRIGTHDVHRAFCLRTGIPMFLLRDDERLRRDTLVGEFRRRVIGQHEAIARVVDTLCTIKARLQPPGKPLANFLFIGPTGVGKTEVAKTLARILFGSPDRMARFDMSEYADPWAAERLIRGTVRDDGELTRRVRQQPFSVLLLDEIEKAHPAVFDLLLQVLGEGRLTDSRGQTTHFGNTIVIMTSNLGAAHRPRGSGTGLHGADERDAAASASAERRHYLDQVDRHFRPEFVNRIDRVIPFASLRADEMHQVAAVSLARIRERAAFAQRGIELEVSATALAELARAGYSPVYGARALRRHLEDHLVAPIAALVSRAGEQADGAWIGVATTELPAMLGEAKPTLSLEHGALRLALVRGRGARAHGRADGIDRIGRLRRNATAAAALSRVADLRQRLAYLTAELAEVHGGRVDMAASLREHERTRAVLARIDDALEVLERLEELAVVAAAEGERATALVADAEQAHARFEAEFVRAMFESEPHNTITVVVGALDGTAALAGWLRQLARWAEEGGWTVLVHRAGESAPAWPRLPWGPPHPLTSILAELERDPAPSSWRALLLRASGPLAGNHLALEHGLHRLWPLDRASAWHLDVRALAWRSELGTFELGAPHFAPTPRPAADQLHRLPAVRELFADGTVTMPELGLTSVAGLDLGALETLQRLWFGEIVRRLGLGNDLAPELPS